LAGLKPLISNTTKNTGWYFNLW